MAKGKISERKVILYTAGLVLFAGIIRYFAYSVGSVMFYLAFLPFLLYRFISIFNKRKNASAPIDSYRVLVLVFMVVTIVLNIAGWQEADFFLLFLLMVDFLLVINGRF
jgi:hypothetical protein